MSRWIDSNLADRLYMVQKRINFPVPMIHFLNGVIAMIVLMLK